MVKAILDLILAIVRLILVMFCGYKFFMGDSNENKTLYYGMWVLILLITRT